MKDIEVGGVAPWRALALHVWAPGSISNSVQNIRQDKTRGVYWILSRNHCCGLFFSFFFFVRDYKFVYKTSRPIFVVLEPHPVVLALPSRITQVGCRDECGFAVLGKCFTFYTLSLALQVIFAGPGLFVRESIPGLGRAKRTGAHTCVCKTPNLIPCTRSASLLLVH